MAQEVATAYYALLRAQATHRAAREAVRRAEEDLEVARQLQKGGVVEREKVLRAEVALATVQRERQRNAAEVQPADGSAQQGPAADDAGPCSATRVAAASSAASSRAASKVTAASDVVRPLTTVLCRKSRSTGAPRLGTRNRRRLMAVSAAVQMTGTAELASAVQS